MVKPVLAKESGTMQVSLLRFPSHVYAILSELRFYVSVSIHGRCCYMATRFAICIGNVSFLWNDTLSSFSSSLFFSFYIADYRILQLPRLCFSRRRSWRFARIRISKNIFHKNVSLYSATVVSRMCRKQCESEFETKSWLYLIKSYKCYFWQIASVLPYLTLQSFFFSNLVIFEGGYFYS